jgi:hypothetical protein
MTDINQRGATPDEWFHFDFILGLGGNLLPCVPAGTDVRVLQGSALEGKVGKIPSQFNYQGLAHGIPAWQKRDILDNELALWRQDPRLNICVRTGPISGVYAFDIDIEDPQIAHEAQMTIMSPRSPNSVRARPNSAKLLIPFRMVESCKKRKIKLDNNPRGPAIELLADGQQFVAAGSHSSGVRYQWLPGLPDSLPTLTLDQVNQIWAQLTAAYATSDSAKANQIAAAGAATTTPADTQSSVYTQITEPEWQELLQALRFLLDKVQDNDTWSEVGYALLSLQGSRPVGVLWHDFSKKAVGYVEGADTKWWEDHCRQTPRTDYRHIFSMARERGLARVADVSAFTPVADEGPAPSEAAGVPGGPETTGDAISVVPDAPTQPIIRLVKGTYSTIIDSLESAFVPYMYVQGPHLVRQSEAHSDGAIQRTDDALMLIKVTPAWIKKRSNEIANVQRFNSRTGAWGSTDMTAEYVNGLFDLGGWSKLRPLNAIARSPFIREDGTICERPGYDSRARVLYVPGTEYPAIPTDPDQDCARAAIERIRGVFDQFPWKEPASESAFLSHILTEAARLAIDCCPIYFYDAPSAGTGKGLLQEMAARIVHGSNPAIRPWVGDGDEIRKALYASLLAGDRSLWFDNVPTGIKVRSPELCAFITSETWKDRKLGESETLGVPNKCVLVASGNNITPVSDLARRSLVVRMDANTEKLKERVFKIPEGMLRPYVMEHRPQMLVDALTVIKAFHAAKGIPPMPVALQSFGAWSHFCRDPLIWLGFADPVVTQKETDDEVGSVGNIFETLEANFADREFTGLDVARLVNGLADPNGELANSLMENGCTEPNNPKKVGYWLRGCRDRISHGLKLVHAGNAKTGVKWKFVRMHEDLT